jgi:hypothetical protein
MNLEFVNDLNESSQYRTRFSLKQTNARNIADHAFMDLISLWILYNEYEYAPMAIEYARKTVGFGNFNSYRQSGTDLYMTLNILSTKNNAMLGGGEADQVFFENIFIPTDKIIQYLRKTATNKLTAIFARQILQELERSLKISNSNYRSLRRMAQNWGILSETQKSLVMTRLIQYYRANARKSELFHLITELSNEKGYKINDASDAENKDSRSMSSAAKLALLGATSMASYHIGKNIAKKLL